MTSKDNLEALKNCYETWHASRGASTDVWFDLMDENIDFRSLAMARDPSVAFTAQRSSKAQVREFLDGLLGDWSMDYYTIDDYVVDGDRICAIGSTGWTNRKTGLSAETPKMDYVRFSNGKIVAYHEFYDTAGLIAAASGAGQPG